MSLGRRAAGGERAAARRTLVHPTHGDDELDIWLISWVPDRSTELHDHGGSLGALTVVSGALRETRWDGSAPRHRRLSAGDQAAFPLGWIGGYQALKAEKILV